MANHTMHFWCDNMAVVQVINSFSSKLDRVMCIVRAFTLCCLRLNLLVLVRHVSGVANGVAAVLSCKQIEKFCQLAPDSNPELGSVPWELWRLED